MPFVEMIMDYFLQYVGTQFLKDVTYKMALWFQNFFDSNIVKNIVRTLFASDNNLVIYRDTNLLVLNKPPNILINSDDPGTVIF